MNEHSMKKITENDESLRHLLGEWKVDATLPPRFQERVWQRIEREAVRPNPWRAFTHWVEATFNRPVLAVSYVALLIFAGLATGYLQVRDTSARAETRWRAAYVQSIDPYQVPRN